MGRTTRISTDVSFSAGGVQHGYLRVPHSTDNSAYGWIPVPITIVNNGHGPSVLLMAGNHGDEYEGQVLLLKLIRNVPQEAVRGRLIILPGVNAPAVDAGKRVSPVDGGNLNRLFPGDADGTPTQMIAHYIDSVLLPLVRYCFDFHSGGYSLEYVPAAHLVAPSSPTSRDEALGFLTTFAMPNSILIEGLEGDDQLLLGSCRRNNVAHMSTELGGAGSFSVDAFRMAERGLMRLLTHVGALATGDGSAPPPSRFYVRRPAQDLVYASARGIFEPYVKLGEDVREGDIAGLIHHPETPWRCPEPVTFETGGTVLARRTPARTDIGDCLFALGSLRAAYLFPNPALMAQESGNGSAKRPVHLPSAGAASASSGGDPCRSIPCSRVDTESHDDGPQGIARLETFPTERARHPLDCSGRPYGHHHHADSENPWR